MPYVWGMKDWVIVGAFVLILFGGASWGVRSCTYAQDKAFLSKEEQLRREAFEQSKAYNEGVAKDLHGAQLDYIKANPEQKKAIASVVLHRLAGYDTTQLPPDLRSFVSELQASQSISSQSPSGVTKGYP
jgi:hypothetical protein